MAEEEKDDWLDDLDDDDGDSELDQSDIESLLSGDIDSDSDEGSEPAEDEDAGEIDSADIDSLLSGSDDDIDLNEPAEEESAAPEDNEIPDFETASLDEDSGAGDGGDDSDIGQSDIDALLSETDSPGDDEDIEDPDQSEIDKLFSEVDDDDVPEGDPFQAEEIDFKDVIDSDSGDDESFMDGTGTAFDAEEFGIDDEMPDIPDLSTDDDSADDSTALFDDGDQATEISDEATVLMGSDDAKEGSAAQKISLILANMPPALQNRKTQGIIGGLLVLLLLIGVFLFRGGDESSEDIAQDTTEEQATPAAEQTMQTPPQTVNTPPVVSDAEFSLAQGSNELAVTLTALDAEGDKLSYEMLSLPLYGKLSGQAPSLIYVPGKEFKGQDSFMFRVSDGKNISQPANIKISAPLIQVAATPTTVPTDKESTAAKPKTRKQAYKPKKLVIAAKNKAYKVDSTDDLIIDWEEIWSSANYLPFTEKVKVEIVSGNLHGKLKRLGSSQSLYTPDMYFGGKEKIKYRFKLGKTISKVKELKVSVNLGSPPPTIKLAEMAPAYIPGETVVIDAKESRDENRENVKFTWQQLSGVPIQLETLNDEESQVAFVVPSSFNTVANPGPVLRLVVTDEDGQTDTKDIKISTRSRRPTAMWRGIAGGGIADDPYCPYENCPGGLLPWPYDD